MFNQIRIILLQTIYRVNISVCMCALEPCGHYKSTIIGVAAIFSATITLVIGFFQKTHSVKVSKIVSLSKQSSQGD